MPEFIQGLSLCRLFFEEEAKPILDKHLPDLRYTAGLLGYGSDVLGYDDRVSTDHMWGPRFHLFLSDGDMELRPHIEELFSQHLPRTFRGYSVNFSPPDPDDHGVRRPVSLEKGPVSPLIDYHTPGGFLEEYLGAGSPEVLGPRDWLTFSEHRLLGVTSGELFVDGLALERRLKPLRYYPEEVRRYLIASNWAVIGQEQAFVKRCAKRGDDLGSRIICARIADRLMRLCFLYCKRYAPYSKWFGTAFRELPLDRDVRRRIGWMLSSENGEEREHHLVTAQLLVAELHNQMCANPVLDARAQPYFHRDIQVIGADRIAQAIRETLTDPFLRSLPLVGTLSQTGNLTELYDPPEHRDRVGRLYDFPAAGEA